MYEKGIIIAIMSAIFTSGTHIFLKKSYKELNPSISFLFYMLIGLMIWIPIGLIFGAPLKGVLKCLIYAIVFDVLSEVLSFYALSKGNLSVSTVLISTHSIYTLIFSTLFNKEILLPIQVLCIIITIIGTILTIWDSNFNIKDIKKTAFLIPLITAVSIGLADALTKGIINSTSSFDFIVAIALVQIPISTIYLLISKQKISTIIKELKKGCIKKYKYSIIGALFNVLGMGCLFLSFDYTYASIAVPLSEMYIPFVVIYSFVKLKEKINKVNLCGIIVALIFSFGIIVIG